MAGWLGNSCPPSVRGNASKGCSNFNFSAARRSARRALPFFRPKVPLPKVDISWISASCSLQRVVWENSVIGKIKALPSNFTMCIFQNKVARIQKLCSLNIKTTGVGAGLPDSCAIHIGLKTNEPSFRSETLAPRLLTVLSLLAIQTTVLLLEFVNPHVKDSSGEVT
ncbi:uncharacterized protein LOC109950775 [Prunus persica]|uniref:uncharacterized protein LOC109950775 n=1 Tax=Prunus persica TaxID=3760 RepID=UPI0009AB2C58|nr:uncharacterized protein LOC109950775 [Prunus persica]